VKAAATNSNVIPAQAGTQTTSQHRWLSTSRALGSRLRGSDVTSTVW
jgi:hypothetical protein